MIAAIFVLSGFAALIYQVAWQRALFSVYGLNVESVTVVVTAFMLGLGVGSLAGGWAAAGPEWTDWRFSRSSKRASAPTELLRWPCSHGSGN